MALKAGYIGLKKGIAAGISDLISKSSGAKWIKSFGDGLDLSDAGELDLEAASASKIGGIKVGEGLEITENGVLNVTVSGGFDYSTSEFDTGQKWIDGKTIYGKVLTGVTISKNAFGAAVDMGVVVDKVINFTVESLDAGGAYSPGLASAVVETTTTSTIKFISAMTSYSSATVIVLYTKVEPAANTRKKGGSK